ncbi:hypothetical protein [Streptomyces lavendulocolor]|uniref:hypothetical protein n=1 Tax=Streptomyces lavendulocolor TaxID=67316 RepID=UPI003C2DFA7B
MARIVFPLHRALTNERTTAVYELAEKFKLGICLYGNTPSLNRDSFTWLIEGGILRVRQFKRALKAMP